MDNYFFKCIFILSFFSGCQIIIPSEIKDREDKFFTIMVGSYSPNFASIEIGEKVEADHDELTCFVGVDQDSTFLEYTLSQNGKLIKKYNNVFMIRQVHGQDLKELRIEGKSSHGFFVYIVSEINEGSKSFELCHYKQKIDSGNIDLVLDLGDF